VVKGKKRVGRRVLAAAVVAGLVLAGVVYLAARGGRARPVFREDAWTEAVEILREEVGAEAVEKGLFTIPRREIPLREGVGMYLHVNMYSPRVPDRWPSSKSRELIVKFLFDGDDSFITVSEGIFRRRSTPQFRRELRIARLSREDAARMAAVFCYLDCAVAPRLEPLPTNGVELVKTLGWGHGGGWQFFWEVLPKTWEAERSARKGWTYLGTLLAVLRKRLALAYWARLVAEGLPFAATAEEAGALATEVVSLNKGRLEQRWRRSVVAWAVHVIDRHMYKPAVPVLEDLQRICDVHELRRKWQGKPILEWFAPDWPALDGDNIAYIIATVEEFGDMSDEDALDALAAKAYARGDGSGTIAYAKHLAEFQPGRTPSVLLENYPAFTRDRGIWTLYHFYEHCSGDPALARLAADEDDPMLRCMANCELHRLTGDRAALGKALEALPGWRYPLDNHEEHVWWTRAHHYLADAFADDPSLVEIPLHFRERLADFVAEEKDYTDIRDFGENAAASVVRTLIVAGGEDNVAALLEAHGHDMEKSEADHSWTLFTAPGVLQALTASRDPHIEKMMLDYLATVDALEDPVCRCFLQALAAKGDPRVPAIADALLSKAGAPDDAPETWTPSAPSPRDEVRVAALEARMRNAADPLGFLLDLAPRERTLVTGRAVDVLAETYTVERLRGLLAEDRSAPIRLIVYAAIVRREWHEAALRIDAGESVSDMNSRIRIREFVSDTH
jgi:hypothetical protein